MLGFLVTGYAASPAIGAMIYWTGGGAAISRANLDGTGIQYNIILDSVQGIAVDPVNGRVYWNNPVTNALRSARLDGTDIQTIIPNAGSGDMSLDWIHGKVYWTGGGAAISRANLDGTGIDYNIIPDSVMGIAVDPLNGRVYWNNPVTNALRWARLDGTNIETIIPNAGSGDISLGVPEPAALSLLALGGLALLLRRLRRP
jgi:uncharacterized protein with LGFP repeats